MISEELGRLRARRRIFRDSSTCLGLSNLGPGSKFAFESSPWKMAFVHRMSIERRCIHDAADVEQVQMGRLPDIYLSDCKRMRLHGVD